MRREAQDYPCGIQEVELKDARWAHLQSVQAFAGPDQLGRSTHSMPASASAALWNRSSGSFASSPSTIGW